MSTFEGVTLVVSTYMDGTRRTGFDAYILNDLLKRIQGKTVYSSKSIRNLFECGMGNLRHSGEQWEGPRAWTVFPAVADDWIELTSGSYILYDSNVEKFVGLKHLPEFRVLHYVIVWPEADKPKASEIRRNIWGQEYGLRYVRQSRDFLDPETGIEYFYEEWHGDGNA